jgi:hypothetical protein
MSNIRFAAAISIEALSVLCVVIVFLLGGFILLVLSAGAALIVLEHTVSDPHTPYIEWRREWEEIIDTYY